MVAIFVVVSWLYCGCLILCVCGLGGYEFAVLGVDYAFSGCVTDLGNVCLWCCLPLVGCWYAVLACGLVSYG